MKSWTPAFSELRSTSLGSKFSWAIWFLLAIHAVVVFAGFFAPYSFQTQER